VTLIRQQAKSRFRDYVNTILQGQVYFGRDQVVKDSKDSEYLARIAAEEDDHYVLEEIAKNKFTPQDTLKELSENESVSVRFALLENPNLNADLKSKINREKEISDAIANREKEISDAIANREKEREKEISDAIWDLFTNAGIRGLTYLELRESLKVILYGSSVEKNQQTSKSFFSKFKRKNIKRLDESDKLKVWKIIDYLFKSQSLVTTEVQRPDQPGDENTVCCLQNSLNQFYREQYKSESEEIWNERLRQIWRSGSL
jgi:hypothetical protein